MMRREYTEAEKERELPRCEEYELLFRMRMGGLGLLREWEDFIIDEIKYKQNGEKVTLPEIRKLIWDKYSKPTDESDIAYIDNTILCIHRSKTGKIKIHGKYEWEHQVRHLVKYFRKEGIFEHIGSKRSGRYVLKNMEKVETLKYAK